MSIQAVVRGNLTKDPEAREVKVDGQPRRLVEIRVFSDEYRQQGDDLVQDDEKCSAVDVTIWNERLGDQVMNLLKKGVRVEVSGNMHLHRYKDRETQEPRAQLRVTADTITLALSSRIEHISFAPSRRERDAELPA